MDRISQLQDGVDQLLYMLITSIDYLSSTAPFMSTNEDVPITQNNPNFISQEELENSKRELAKSIVRRIKDNDELIMSLPQSKTSSVQKSELVDLKKQNGVDFEDLMTYVHDLEKVSDDITAALDDIESDLLA
ncbi:hypothetical protein K502DRAFT_345335 [Neoconidiobolus thromboides FSU 785]|nr:hypothetical protein K502DRAFT_345335 [Neoconidiobolus thromboides FSU 785]